MTIPAITFFLLVVFVGGYLLVSKRAQSGYLARAEYWVYLPEDQMPGQDPLMTWLVATNPFSKRGQSPIGPGEGLIMSDVRLAMTLVLKAKNPHLFDPRIVLADIENLPEDAATILSSQSLVRLRFISEQPLPNKRHLQFLIYAVAGYLELGAGHVAIDPVAKRLWRKEDLFASLKSNFDATVAELHVSKRVEEVDGAIELSTHGLEKVGAKDLAINPIPHDVRTLGVEVLEQLVDRIWEGGVCESEITVEAFGDQFIVTPEPGKRGGTPRLKIHRVHLNS